MALLLDKGCDGVPSIKVLGRFDFTVNREFREMCKSLETAQSCVVDMEGTTYLDSSALGMLLLLKEQVSSVRITGANPQVRKVLDIANFGGLFEVDA